MDWIYILIVAIIVIWLIGLVLKIGGKFIHFLLVLAVIFFALKLLNII